MKEVLIFLLFMLLAFPFGMAFAAFLRWLSKQKRGAPSRQAVTSSWPALGMVTIPLSLVSAAVAASRHRADLVHDHLIEAAFFAVACFGAWAETRHFQRRR